jgi:hypothetical protein
MTPAEIEPATFRFVAQRLNHCATAVPHVFLSIIESTTGMPQPKITFTFTFTTQATSYHALWKQSGTPVCSLCSSYQWIAQEVTVRLFWPAPLFALWLLHSVCNVYVILPVVFTFVVYLYLPFPGVYSVRVTVSVPPYGEPKLHRKEPKKNAQNMTKCLI